MRFSVEARALPRGIEAFSLLEEEVEDFDFLFLEPEAVGAGLRFELEAAVDAGMFGCHSKCCG